LTTQAGLPDDPRREEGNADMPDDKTKRGAADRRRVAGGEAYEVNYFARKHGITKEQAQKLIGRIGGDRDKLNREAGELKKR